MNYVNENKKFEFLDVGKNTNNKSKISASDYRKYSKILNNLLGINSRSDYAVFTRLNPLNLDVTKLIKPENIKSVFSKPSFRIKLEKVDISKARKKDFESDNVYHIYKWKRYIKQVYETYQQTSIWPLFIGTYFLKGRVGEKTIYAPLVLKEVEIVQENNDIYLIERNSSVVLNEKIIFLLNEFLGISIPNVKDEIDKASLDDVMYELDMLLKDTIDFENIVLDQRFEEIKAQDIKNLKIVRTNGVVLLFAQPTGGALRNAVIDLIKEDKMDKLIEVNLNDVLSSPEQSIMNIVYKPLSIARICPTDPSQENAIISSLKQNTIIIGPPGTGKSQTISNILANILLNNKRALFISQKRVALEVVLERMKSLQYFTLQLVEYKSKSSISEKNTFYEYMNNFLEIIKSSMTRARKLESVVSELKPLISYNRLQYWKSKDIENISQNDVDVFSKLENDNAIISESSIKEIISIFNSFKKMSRFNEIAKVLDLNEININSFAEKLNVPPKIKFLGIKKYDKSFTHFFNLNLELLNFMRKYNFSKEHILLLKDFNNLNKLLEISNSLNYHLSEIPKVNPFISDETKIIDVCANRARMIYQKIYNKDPKWLSRFNGRIQRRFAQPNKFISLFKEELKQLFNIYVSTPEALSSFVDFKNDRFDYVIFDEASQIFLEKAIPYLAISDKIIVAGDDQQMQPSNWFGHRSDVEDQDKEEENIDSLLTYAIENGINKEMLELNYRSTAATLTTFSSREFYECNLKTIDNNKELDKPIEIINVNGVWKDNQNLTEAKKVIEVLKDNIDKYKRIIILTLNKQQMELINVELSIQEPEIYNKVIEGEIILKNLENIQGDEADLVIVSIAYTKDAALSATYVGRPGGRNALNVAITRARSKMIVIKSINSKDISTKGEMGSDLKTFKNWIEFLELNEDKQKSYSVVEDRRNYQNIQSNFELNVIEWLKTKSFNRRIKLEYQYPIGSYRIDVALLDADTDKFILGIEVDGFLYHSTVRQKYNDLVRQNFIEAKGYKLLRISELLWKTDKERLFEMIKEKIENNGKLN